jgi:hypothetical protein
MLLLNSHHQFPCLSLPTALSTSVTPQPPQQQRRTTPRHLVSEHRLGRHDGMEGATSLSATWRPGDERRPYRRSSFIVYIVTTVSTPSYLPPTHPANHDTTLQQQFTPRHHNHGMTTTNHHTPDHAQPQQ